MNLADKFFEMDRNSAVRGLEIYKENVVRACAQQSIIIAQVKCMHCSVCSVPASMHGLLTQRCLCTSGPQRQAERVFQQRESHQHIEGPGAAADAASAATGLPEHARGVRT